MPDVVRVGGAELVRTREANGEFTYRPVDATGAVVDAAAFEARKKAERAAKLANDPRVAERAANEWAAQQRAAIARTRVDESRRLTREEARRRERAGGTTGPRRRTRELGANVKPSKALADLREEMRVALATGLEKKNPGAHSFLKAALDVEEAKHSKLVDAARKRDYAKARKSKGVKGDAGLDATLSSGDDEDDVPRVRGSLADLDDPDYRRGPAPSGAEPSVEPKTKAKPKPVKGACRRCGMQGHYARDCEADANDVAAAAKELADKVEKLEVKPKSNKSTRAKQANVDADDPDYRRSAPASATGDGAQNPKQKRGGGGGRGGRGGRGGGQLLVFSNT